MNPVKESKPAMAALLVPERAKPSSGLRHHADEKPSKVSLPDQAARRRSI